MKLLALSALLLSSSTFALTLPEFKAQADAAKSTWAANHVGQTKVVTISGSADNCTYSTTSTQTVLKFESGKLIILAQDKFTPAATPECQALNYQAFEEKILFYQDLPGVVADLAYLDDPETQVSALTQNGTVVELVMTMSGVPVIAAYDLAQSGFQNLISTSSEGVTTTVAASPDLDVNALDLSNVLFCDNNDGDNSECSEGNFSDILF
jgi:hypothetical protein